MCFLQAELLIDLISINVYNKVYFETFLNENQELIHIHVII